MYKPDWQLGIITIQGFIWINSLKYFFKEYPLSILSVSTSTTTRWTILILESDQIVLFISDKLIFLSNIPRIGIFLYYDVIIILSIISYAHGLHCKHYIRMTMNEYHFNEYKQDSWKCYWLIGHIISNMWSFDLRHLKTSCGWIIVFW